MSRRFLPVVSIVLLRFRFQPIIRIDEGYEFPLGDRRTFIAGGADAFVISLKKMLDSLVSPSIFGDNPPAIVGSAIINNDHLPILKSLIDDRV